VLFRRSVLRCVMRSMTDIGIHRLTCGARQSTFRSRRDNVGIRDHLYLFASIEFIIYEVAQCKL
jgi:hypothetical protein